MSAPTIPEMQADLSATMRDLGCLDEIIANLETFINESHGEDRSHFKVDLFKYQRMHDRAADLKHKIVRAIAARYQSEIVAPLKP